MRTLKNTPSQLFVLLILTSTLFFTGCEKEGLVKSPNDTQRQSSEDVFVMGSTDGTSAITKLDIDLAELEANTNANVSLRTGNAHAHGNYTTQFNPAFFYKTDDVNFSATENSQGVSGTLHITRNWGDNGEFQFTILADADCLMIDGDNCVMTGLLSSTVGTVPAPLGSLPEGSRWWIKVRDNGQGPNAPLDQYHTGIIWNPSGTIPCEIFGPASIIWNFSGVMNDVANESDNIKIN